VTFEPLPPRKHESAFSNGTEFEVWQDANCARCVHDPFSRDDRKESCPLLCMVLGVDDVIPAEWIDGPRDEQGLYSMEQQYTCLMFRDYRDRGGEEPQPVPDPPDQEALFDRDGWERPARMFAQAETAEVSRA
jgi:hypothetical protein